MSEKLATRSKTPILDTEQPERLVSTGDYELEDRRGDGGKTPVILYGGFRATDWQSLERRLKEINKFLPID